MHLNYNNSTKAFVAKVKKADKNKAKTDTFSINSYRFNNHTTL